MGTYKGNKGNLMQHWTLCEVLHIAQKQGVTDLNYIDAHAMAPLATKPASPTQVFQRVQAKLPCRQSVYEKAWHTLASKPADGYPNSAKFVTQVWQDDYSLLLCEKEDSVADEVASWLSGVSRRQACKAAMPFRGDWRSRFNEGLPSPFDVGLGDDALTILSFDPNMYDRNGPPKDPKPENMYPSDLHTVLEAVQGITGSILIQLSTYYANNANAQADVIGSVNSILKWKGGFDLTAIARADGNMMSLIYTRHVTWAGELAVPHEEFGKWIKPYLKR